mmetsp:Transcript_4185/g.11542  ORF Transcript_4185/g.11542 Transcript_4185/m.11542 type:complete len:843 (-) Transcript_4185:257-2785(-)
MHRTGEMATTMARTEVAEVGGGSPLRSNRHSLPPQSSRPALESAVDAYANRVLHMKSPPEASVDDSLGPYVTSIIRCSLSESASHNGPNVVDVYDMDVEELIEDFESLLELLEGHCGMSPDVAKSALHSIAISVKTGVVDAFDDGDEQHLAEIGSFRSAGILGTSLGSMMSFDGSHGGGRLGRSFRSKSVGAANDHEGMAAIQMLGNMLRDTGIGGHRDVQFGAGFGDRGDYSPSDENDDEFAEHPSFIMDEDIIPDDIASIRGAAQYHSPIVPENSALSTPLQSSASSSLDQGGHEHSGNVASVGSELPALTPMKLNRLIPEDLMGVLDNPVTPAPSCAKPNEGEVSVRPNIYQQSDAAFADESSDKISKKGKGKRQSKADAQDLAASLFRPSRTRSNSVSQDKSPMLKPLSTPAPAMLSFSVTSSVRSNLFQNQLNSATQILLSMNGSLGDEAAMEAALVSNNDVNVAQYVIDGAMAAPPVCRHMLHNGCYRSDCHFSHDVEGHTCLFWLRGRCGKGDGCRFMHGFSEKLLDGIKKDFLPNHSRAGVFSPSADSVGEGESPIQTANLVQHNMCISSSAPKHAGRAFSFLSPSQGKTNLSSSVPQRAGGSFSFLSPPQGKDHVQSGQLSMSLPKRKHSFNAKTPSPQASAVLQSTPMHSSLGGQLQSETNTETPNSSSVSAWSNVAQRGYSLTSFSPSDDTEAVEMPRGKGRNKIKTVKIPQNLWNPSEKRCSSAFHIADPMKRYAEVSSTHPRKDVLDLHYQSIKTFSMVLSQVLHKKLRKHNEVWVLTGTGHHVARNSHQKSGGVLESGVMSWLDDHGYDYARGKDRNGFCGAVLVKPR